MYWIQMTVWYTTFYDILNGNLICPSASARHLNSCTIKFKKVKSKSNVRYNITVQQTAAFLTLEAAHRLSKFLLDMVLQQKTTAAHVIHETSYFYSSSVYNKTNSILHFGNFKKLKQFNVDCIFKWHFRKEMRTK